MNERPKIPPISDVTKQVDVNDALAADKVAAEFDADLERLRQERDLRRAFAIQFVQSAREHEGRGNAPWSAHDANVAYSMASLAHLVAGQGFAPRAPAAVATSPVATTRRTDSRVETGIEASSVSAGIVANSNEATS